MKLLAKPLTLILDRMQRRFRLSRPGSVLILVVALLVLMALIGTAYISTTRIDRYAVKDSSAANQLNISDTSVLDMAVGGIMNDLYDGTNYRAITTDPNVPSTYDNWDGFSTPGPSMNIYNNQSQWGNPATPAAPIADPNDVWLAARYPSLLYPTQKLDADNNPPIWTSISYPPFQNISSKLKAAGSTFENYSWEFDSPVPFTDGVDPAGGTARTVFPLSLGKLYFEPTYLPINGVNYPALRARLPMGSSAGQYATYDYQTAANLNAATFLAADADGDGIADAGLFKLPIPPIDGITYYGAVRIIDNNSALNVNTAWAQGDANYEGDRTAWSNDPSDSTRIETRDKDRLVNYYFPTSIDLASLLRTSNLKWWNALGYTDSSTNGQGWEMEYLKEHWWDTKWFGPSPSGGPSGIDTRDDTTGKYGQTYVWGDDGSQRVTYNSSKQPEPEFLYNSIGDAMYAELGRRPEHPGLNYDQSPTTPANTQLKSYQAFGPEDALALAYHFCMINPNAARSPLEQLFYQAGQKAQGADSIYTLAPNYGATQAGPQYKWPAKGNWVTLDAGDTSYPAQANSVLQWFADNFDYDSMWNGVPQQSELSDQGDGTGEHTYFHSRRTMLVPRNPVSNQQPRRNMNGLWDMDINTLGDGANWTAVGPVLLSTKQLYDETGSQMLAYDGTKVTDPSGNWLNLVWGEQMPYWNTSTKYGYSGYVAPKASVNTASFGELWRAFWNVMSDGDGMHTPFDDSFKYTIGDETVNAPAGRWGMRPPSPALGDGYTLNDPYVGQKFWDEAIGAGTTNPTPFLAVGDTYYNSGEAPPDFDPTAYPFTSSPRVPYGWNPARMFRSSIRATPIAGATGAGPAQSLEVNQSQAFDPNSPRLPAFQELLLRAAIAAVNAEDMRHSSFESDIVDPSVVVKDANGQPTTQPVRDPRYTGLTTDDRRDIAPYLIGHGTGDVTAHRIRLTAVLENTYPTSPTAQQNVNVVVYGYQKQPFITEVFADTDTKDCPPAGYVAIELYNPYDHDIEMTNWKLVALDRRHDTNSDIAGGHYGLHFQNYATDVNHDLLPGVQPSSPELIADFDPDRQGQQLDSSGQTVQQVWPFTRDLTTGKAKPLIVPAHGYLLLENHPDGLVVQPGPEPFPPGQYCANRPTASGLPPDSIPSANAGTDRSYRFESGKWVNNNNRANLNLPQLNVAFVPGLSGLVDKEWDSTGTGGSTESWPQVRSVLNRELVILRPRRADGVYSKGFYPPLFNVNQKMIAEPMRYDENWALTDLVPVDSFDFTGLQLSNSVSVSEASDDTLPNALHRMDGQMAVWHYVRQNADAAPQTFSVGSTATQFEPGQWKFVYPGRYDACPASGAGMAPLTWSAGMNYPGTGGSPVWGADLNRPRQQGTEVVIFDATSLPTQWPPNNPAPVYPVTPVTLGANGDFAANNNNTTASYPTGFPIQLDAEGWQKNALANTAWEGINSSNKYDVNQPSAALFPFGGFARNGDLMQIPFIGAYRISRVEPSGYSLPSYTNPAVTSGTPLINAEPPPGSDVAALGNTIIELNSITMDSVFAEDTDFDDDPRFQINTAAPASPAQMGNIDITMLTSGKQKYTPDTGTTQGREQIGRFCPLLTLIRGGDTRTSVATINPPVAQYVSGSSYQYVPTNGTTKVNTINSQEIAIDDYASDPSFRPANGNTGAGQVGADWRGYWRYHWATHLFDFLTVQAPHDDAMPDYPIQQPWKFDTFYTVGQVVTYTDRINKYLPNNQPNPLYMVPCAYVCTYAHPSGTAGFPLGYENSPFLWYQDPMLGGHQVWHLLSRIPQSNSGGQAGNGVNPQAYTAEYAQPVEGLININTANWKVLSTLPLIVNPDSGMTVDPNDSTADKNGDVVIPQFKNLIRRRSDNAPLTYRALNEELAKAIEYYRDVDGQPNPAGPPPNNAPVLVPHGPYKSIDELNSVVDLRPSSEWKLVGNASVGNPFYGHGFADAMGLLPMKFLNPDRNSINYSAPRPGDGDPDGGLGDLSPGRKLYPRPLTGSQTDADGVRGDFEEQFLQLDRISNLITTRSDSFTCYVLVQGWKNAGTANASLAVQKRVAYIIDRSMAPYRPVKKTVVPND